MPDFSQRCAVKRQEVTSFRKGNSSWREGKKKKKSQQVWLVKAVEQATWRGYVSLEIFKT